MTERLRDSDLKDYAEVADKMDAEGLPIYASIIRELLTEVHWLRSREAAVTEAAAQALVDQAQRLDMGY